MRFWIPWGIAAAVTTVSVLFFVSGVASGAVSSFNAGLWILILLGTIGVTGGSMALMLIARPSWN